MALTLPYLTLPYAEGVLPPSAIASNGHMRIHDLTLRLLEPFGVFNKLQE